MSDTEDHIIWTVDAIRARLLEGRDPRDIGGADALAGRPYPCGGYMPVFLREIHTKIEALSQILAKEVRDQLGHIEDGLRGNPFATEDAFQRIRSTIDGVDTYINERIAHSLSDLMGKRKDAEECAAVYRRDLQQARASHPRKGWIDKLKASSSAFAIGVVDGAIGYFILEDALGPVPAVFTGLGLAFLSLGGGALSALALLRPTDYASITPLSRALQWFLAILCGSFTVAASYIGACYRAALIEGLNGDYADILAKFVSPKEVLLNPEVLFLMAIGLLGIILGARKLNSYYNGYRSLLRDSGIAKDRADLRLDEMAAELKRIVEDAGTSGTDALDEITEATGIWVRSSAELSAQAATIILDANERLDLLLRVFIGIVAEYQDGYKEIKPGNGPDQLQYAPFGQEFYLPPLINELRSRAIEAVKTVSDRARVASLEISQLQTNAIARIDALAGFVKPKGDGGLLPSGEG